MQYLCFFTLIVVGCSTGSRQPTMFAAMESEQETVPRIMSVETARSQGNSPQQPPSPQSAQPEFPGIGGQLPQCPGAYNEKWTNCVGAVKLSSGVEYVGQWRDGQANGQGTFLWPDGRKYVGEFRDSKYNGQGTYMWPDGGKYVGEFRDSRRNGHGIQTYASGAKYVGEWKNGEANGQGTEYGADGRVLRSGLWENGIFIKGQ
jgi:hypothetical protein